MCTYTVYVHIQFLLLRQKGMSHRHTFCTCLCFCDVSSRTLGLLHMLNKYSTTVLYPGPILLILLTIYPSWMWWLTPIKQALDRLETGGLQVLGLDYLARTYLNINEINKEQAKKSLPASSQGGSVLFSQLRSTPPWACCAVCSNNCFVCRH